MKYKNLGLCCLLLSSSSFAGTWEWNGEARVNMHEGVEIARYLPIPQISQPNKITCGATNIRSLFIMDNKEE